MQETPSNVDNSVFLMAPSLVPQQMEPEQETEVDAKSELEEQNFHSFVQQHMTVQQGKRDRQQQQQNS